MFCSMPQGGVERPDIEKIGPSSYHIRQIRNMQTVPSVEPCQRRSKGNRKKRHRCVRAPTVRLRTRSRSLGPRPVALVLRCRAEMVMIVEVKTWSRRPVLRTGAAGAPTRKETAGPHSACVVRSRRRHVHLQRRRAGDRPAMPWRGEAHPSPFLRLRQRSRPASWCGHTRQILEDKEEFQVT